MTSVVAGRRTIRPATRPQTPVPPLPWMLQGSSLGRWNMAWNSVRFIASSDSRIDSSAGSSVRPASRVTPIAIANGIPRLE